MREDFDPDLSRYIVDMLMSFEEYKYRDVLSGSNIFPNRINIRSSFEDSIRDYIKFITQQIQYDQQRGDELKSYKQKSNKRHRKE